MLDLSRISALPITHLNDLRFESQGAFPAEGQMYAVRLLPTVALGNQTTRIRNLAKLRFGHLFTVETYLVRLIVNF